MCAEKIAGESTGNRLSSELASELFIFDLFLNFWGLKFGSGAVSKKRPGFLAEKSRARFGSVGRRAAGQAPIKPRCVMQSKPGFYWGALIGCSTSPLFLPTVELLNV